MYNQPYFYQPKKTEIIHVNGENGARAFQMLPNSQALLLDDTAPLVWLAQTDGAGYKTVIPYTIAPYEPAPPIDINALDERITKLERLVNNDKSNARKSDNSKQSKAVD